MVETTAADIAKAEETVTRLGDVVRSKKALLKEGKGTKADVDAAIEALKQSKISLEKVVKEHEAIHGPSTSASKEQFRAAVSNTLERKMFYIPSFKIYGSVAGFYDYGPPGCSVKSNITQYWRQHFVLEENMLEVECPAVTPEVVLKASGHVDRFTDLMVKDKITGDCYRADHLLEKALDTILDDPKQKPSEQQRKEIENVKARLDDFTEQELWEQLQKYNVKATDTNNDISPPFPFNLMFKTSIGPRGDQIGYLRPETAQGIFVNFKDLLYFNGGKLPFAAAQIGQSYRNEIAPRQGLLRVREFTQAEIEHFCNPEQKEHHPKFSAVADLAPLLYSRDLQMGDEKKAKPMRLGDAVSQKIIANETLGYFIGRTYQFLEKIGIHLQRLRFRQHLPQEMAHYAEDCWDAEIECSYGWIECVGLADRSAYDLKAHADKSKMDMSAREALEKPIDVEAVNIDTKKQIIGKTFRAKAKDIQAALEALSVEDAMNLDEELNAGDGNLTVGKDTVQISRQMVAFQKVTKKVSSRSFIPSVVEPSFGIGRIMYCMFEHCFYSREADAQRTVFKFTPLVAPTKATVFPLVSRPEMISKARAISDSLRKAGVSNLIDTTGTTVGKRYARTDELGIPFGVTVDAQTQEDNTVTVRERDTTRQIRVPVDQLADLLRRLSAMEIVWDDVKGNFEEVKVAEES